MTPQPQQDRENELAKLIANELKDHWLVFSHPIDLENVKKEIEKIIRTSRPATHEPHGVCPDSVKICPEVDCDKCRQAASKAREKLFEAIRAERDPHLDYVDWDSIEAAYMRTGGEPR